MKIIGFELHLPLNISGGIRRKSGLKVYSSFSSDIIWTVTSGFFLGA
jgi:hypothetical protein